MDAKKHVFTSFEKKCFIDIIKKYSKIIENKNSDGSSLRRKNEAWDKVTAEFNANPLATSQATHKQLRRLWMNMKQRQREALAKKRQLRLVTGGGPSRSTFIDPDVAAVDPAPILGIDEVIDSDPLQAIEVRAAAAQIAQTILGEPFIPPETTKMRESSIKESPVSPVPSGTFTPSTKTEDMSPNFNIIEEEYKDRRKRANEKHEIEMEILKEQLREAKAKANLAELILKHTQDPFAE